MSDIVIFGNGLIAKTAKYYFDNDSDYNVVAFTADKQYINSSKFLGLPLLSINDCIEQYSPFKFKMFVALSYSNMNKDRAEKYFLVKKLGYELVNYISSKCTFLTEHPIGDNCFILENNTIQPYVKIKNNVFLWSGNHIGHETVIENHCNVTSHVVVSGNVRVKSYSFLGVNSTLKDGITIAQGTLVGAGSIILEDTIENGVYVPPKSILLNKKSFEINI